MLNILNRFELIKSYCHLIIKNGILHPMWIENIIMIIHLMLTWVLSKKGLDSVNKKRSHLEVYEIREMINESCPLVFPNRATKMWSPFEIISQI